MQLRCPPLLSFAALAAVWISILWIDRPLANFFAGFRLGHAVFSNSAFTVPIIDAFGFFGMAIGLGYLFSRRKLPKWAEAAMLAGAAQLLGQIVTHELLKPLFGRVVPSEYLRTGQFGFHFFRSGDAFGSFPSGHSTQAAGALSVMWVTYPKWRWFYIMIMVGLAAALMVGQWHYLSDVIAGVLVGCAAGRATMLVWSARHRFSKTHQ